MNIETIFSAEILHRAMAMFKNQQVIILEERNNTVDALVYDDFFYRVSISFSEDYTTARFTASRDGYSQVCPYSRPYVAAVFVKLMVRGSYNLECHCFVNDESVLLKQRRTFSAILLPDYIANSHYYHDVLGEVIPYILRLQNYNSDDNAQPFSLVLDDLFEYIDSLANDSKQTLITLQVFMHVYLRLPFEFKVSKDLHNVIIDECNLRISEIIAKTEEPVTQALYRMMLLNDHELCPLLYNMNIIENHIN